MRITNFSDPKFLSYNLKRKEDYLNNLKSGKEIYPYLIEILGNWEEFDELELYITKYLGFPFLDKEEGYIGWFTNDPIYIDYNAYLLSDKTYYKEESRLIEEFKKLNKDYFESYSLEERLKQQYSFSYDGCWHLISSLKTSYDYGYVTYGFKKKEELDLAINIFTVSNS